MPSEQVKHYSDGISFTWRGKVILPELLSDFSPECFISGIITDDVSKDYGDFYLL